METRRANVKLMYKGVNISNYIQDDLVSFSYTDNASGLADDVSLVLHDVTEKWLHDWFPEKGDMVHPKLVTRNWCFDGDSQVLDCGSFIIDEPVYTGPPDSIDIKGNSMPSNSNFKEVDHSRSWSSIKLSMIGKDIAARSGLNFYFDSTEDPFIDYVLQDKEADSAFLLGLCEKYGFGFKISSSTIVLYSISDYEGRGAVVTYEKGKSNVISYTLGTTLTGTAYSGVKVRYKDGDEKRWYVFKHGDRDKEKIYKMDDLVEGYAEAEKVALSKFKELNRNEYVIDMTVVGNVDILATSCVVLEGFGKFNGKYFIDTASHSVDSTYSTSFRARKVVEIIDKVAVEKKQVTQVTQEMSGHDVDKEVPPEFEW